MSPSLTSKGKGRLGERSNRSVAATSHWPVAMASLTVPSGRGRTRPLTASTYSWRKSPALRWRSPPSSGLTTTCTTPVWSQSSKKMMPPRSRRRRSHPLSTTSCPSWGASTSPQYTERFHVASKCRPSMIYLPCPFRLNLKIQNKPRGTRGPSGATGAFSPHGAGPSPLEKPPRDPRRSRGEPFLRVTLSGSPPPGPPALPGERFLGSPSSGPSGPPRPGPPRFLRRCRPPALPGCPPASSGP